MTYTNYDLDIITRSQVPKTIYLCTPGRNKEDWFAIHRYIFHNNLHYYIGSNNYISDINDAIYQLKNDFNIFSQFNNPIEIQEYFMNNYNIYKSDKICNKIYNYFYKNRDLIMEII